MLVDKDVAATVAVRDLARARRFYEEVLGLEPAGEMDEEVAVYRSGRSQLMVYVSAEAGTNRANAATWGVGEELEAIVEALKARGVRFEHYDLPGLTLEGDIHVAGAFKAAWFKDPDGNILHINSA